MRLQLKADTSKCVIGACPLCQQRVTSPYDNECSVPLVFGRDPNALSLAIATCKNHWYQETGDMFRLKWKWHSAEELFVLRNSNIQVTGYAKKLRGPHTEQDVERYIHGRGDRCITVSNGKPVIARDCGQPRAKFVSTFNPELHFAEQTLTFKNTPGGGEPALCLTAANNVVEISECSGSASQQFIVSYARDNGVLDYPEPSKFKVDQGPVWDEKQCMNCQKDAKEKTTCCERLTGWQRAADYFIKGD